LPWRIALARDVRHFASSSGRALENAARIHAELAIGIGGRRSQACILLGAAVVVLAPEKYNSIAHWPC
jgi:hypothetical protein